MAANIQMIHDDAGTCAPVSSDMICTDPPYEMTGADLAGILSRHSARHLLLITTMRQLLQFSAAAPQWRLSWDAVLDCVVPKQSKSQQQPNYTHQTVVYMTQSRTPSAFRRKLRQRSDVAADNGYWPTIIRAARNDMGRVKFGKSAEAITDMLGSFDIGHVLDPFAGGGSTGLAAFELGMSATLIERDAAQFEAMKQTLKFIGAVYG